MKNDVKFRTYSPKPADLKPNWVVVDVKGKILGRVANQIADMLRGKNKPTYSKHLAGGDYVIVINAEQIKLTGKKMTDKEYNSHSRFPGGLKTTTPEELLRDKPEEIIRHAVAGMIPQNKLKKLILKRLKIFVGPEHNLTAQNPKTIALNNK